MWEGVELGQRRSLAQVWESQKGKPRITFAPRKKKIQAIMQVHRNRTQAAASEVLTWMWHHRELMKEIKHLSGHVARLWLKGERSCPEMLQSTTRLQGLRER